MRKEIYSKIMALIAMLFLPFMLLAQNGEPQPYGIRIDESFEKGIPSDWVQENVVGSQAWFVESANLLYPAGVADGKTRIAFRNTSGTTTKAKTRLILPAVDVAELYQPVLVFSHAQEKWTEDYDTLRVLYRAAADAQWVELKVYDKYISKWQRDSIFVPVSAYCQVAFEATDNLGRGIVLDDVVIRSTPSCFEPEDLYTSNVSNDSIVLNWWGAFDAEYFYVKLADKKLSAEELESTTTKFIVNTTTDNVWYTFKNLTAGTTYYAYLKSHCENEESGWVETSFRTSNLLAVPALIDFNYTKASNPAWVEGWYYFGSDDNKPFINANDATNNLVYSSSSKTTCLVFGKYKTSLLQAGRYGAVPANTWEYVATPELSGVQVKDLQIRFESVVHERWAAPSSSIIVGVMTDPEDKATFEAVDTITVTRNFTYEEFVVSFASYTGSGKHIAFLSEFPVDNHFTIEDLVIEPRTEASVVNYHIKMPTATSIVLAFEQTYDAYDVIVASASIPAECFAKDSLDLTTIVTRQSVANNATIGSLTAGGTYYVYARSTKGTAFGPWTRERIAYMPAAFTGAYPHDITFEEGNTGIVYCNSFTAGAKNIVPKIVKCLFNRFDNGPIFVLSKESDWSKQRTPMVAPLSANEFTIAAETEYDEVNVAVFPEIDITSTKVSFYAARRDPLNMAAANAKYQYSRFFAGVMTDANDVNSFVVIDTVYPEYEYTYYEFDLSRYSNLEGNFFAIMVDDADATFNAASRMSTRFNRVYLDNMTFAKVSSNCKSPVNIGATVDAATPAKATITWDANGATAWNVKVATEAYDRSLFDTINSFVFVAEAQVTTPSYEATNLKYPNATYYYWIQPVCEDTVDWSETRSFETVCPTSYPIPYVQNFNDMVTGSNVYTGFAAHCMTTTQWTRNGSGVTPSDAYYNKYYYPYVTNTVSYDEGGNSFTLFRKYSSYRNYVSLPLLDEDLDSLEVSFRIYSKETDANLKKQVIAVGVMTDPSDYKTFTEVAQIKPTASGKWQRFVVDFRSYTGEGKYIAFAETNSYTASPKQSTKYATGVNVDTLYLDNIMVNYVAQCAAPYDVKVSNVTANSAKVSWKSDAEKYIFVATNSPFAYNDLIDLEDFKAGESSSFALESNVVKFDTIVGSANNLVEIGQLANNVNYYVYVKGLCDGLSTNYSEEVSFVTFCAPESIASFKADFTNDVATQAPSCWKVGNTIGTPSDMKFHCAVDDGALFLSSSSSVNGVYAIMPNLDVDDITKYKVRFEAYTTPVYSYDGCGSSDYERAIIVGVVTDPYDFATFVAVDTIRDITIGKTAYEVYFENYKYDLNGDKGKFVAFMSYFEGNNRVYLDNIEFKAINTCPRTAMSLQSATTTSVTLAIASAPASYNVYYGTEYLTESDLAVDSILAKLSVVTGTDATVTINNLTPNTEYFFYLRSTADACNDWALPFATYPAEYTVVDVPFFDDFESNKYSLNIGGTPLNWYGSYATDDKSYPSVNTNANNTQKGKQSAMLYAARENSTYLVSPQLNVTAINECYTTFYLYSKTQSAWPKLKRALVVGVVSDVENIESTFVPVDTIYLDKTDAWVYFKVALSNYTGTGKHLAFKDDITLNMSMNTIYTNNPVFAYQIDDVNVLYSPDCFQPELFELTSVTETSLSFAFQHNNGVKFEVKYDTAKFDMTTEVGNTMTITEKQFTLSSLLSDTPYDVYVRAIDANNNTSEWAYAGEYTTLPNVLSTFPYSYGFEDDYENNNWKHRANTETARWYTGIDTANLVADKLNATDKALYFSGDGGKTPKYKGEAITYRYVNLQPGTYSISYDWVAPGERFFNEYGTILHYNYVCAALIPSNFVFGNKVTEFINTDGDVYKISNCDYFDGVIDLTEDFKYGDIATYRTLMGSDMSLPLERQWKTTTHHFAVTPETQGIYMLVFYNAASKDGDTKNADYRMAVVDNINIDYSSCSMPYDVKIDSYSTTTANLSWSIGDKTITNYEVCVLNANVNPNQATEEQIAFRDTVSTTSVNATGLSGFTTYYAFVRSLCSESNIGIWTSACEFTTDVDVASGYVFSFEEPGMNYYQDFADAYLSKADISNKEDYINTEFLFHKWCTRLTSQDPVKNKFDITYAVNYPRIVKDTLQGQYYKNYARTGDYALCLRDAGTAAWANSMTVVMPYAGEFENARLVFYMRCFSESLQKGLASSNATVEFYPPYGSSKFSTNELDDISRKVTVGVMTDPNDLSTFVGIDTIQYPYAKADYAHGQKFLTKDPTGNNGWYRAIVSLENAQGKYIAFRYEHYGTASTDKKNLVYIDDVSVQPIPSCPAPEYLKVDAVKATSIDASFEYEGKVSVEVEIATDSTFKRVAVSTTAKTNPFSVNGLAPVTKYYMRAKAVCSDLDASAWSNVVAFETPLAVRYTHDFDKDKVSSSYWTYSNHNTIFDAFNKKPFNWFTKPSATQQYGWKVVDGMVSEGDFSTPHLFCTSNLAACNWAFTPVFELDAKSNCHLIFDLALTDRDASTAFNVASALSDTTSMFAVVISEDGGNTYKRADAIIWSSNNSYEHSLWDIPNTGKQYSIDLTKYAGKNIKIALYFTSGLPIDLHLDNFHINRYATTSYSASTCQYYDFEDNNFAIMSQDIAVGQNEFSTWKLTTNDRFVDTLVTVNLTVTEVPTTEFNESICDGAVYTGNGFTGLMQDGVYKRKLSSSIGCDSIVTLTLSVVSPAETFVKDTICFGSKYVWEGKEYTRAGLYTDTLVSKVTGCDSIVTLSLSVADIIRTTASVNICFGETYQFGSQTISASGEYQEVFKTLDGCDSLVTLNATVLPNYRQTINAVINDGEVYNDNGFIGLTMSGEYELPLQSVDGCDSTIILNLTVLKDVSVVLDVIICSGQSYTLGSTTITESGQYTETFKTAAGKDSVVVVNATVLPDLRKTITDTICAGEVYNENGFENLSGTGTYTLELTSVDGCDSTLILNLTVLTGDTIYVTKTITTNELPYEYQGIKYDKATLPGTYVDTIYVETENCQEVIVHTLTITVADAIDNVKGYDLVMVPNPVTVSGTLYINADFSAEERDGMIVEVFNAIGQCVYVDVPSVYPVQINGLNESGMYIVRILTGNGKSYSGKVIVE